MSGQRFGIFADVSNLFNTATITSVQTRYPSTTISGAVVPYQAPDRHPGRPSDQLRRTLAVLAARTSIVSPEARKA